VEGNRFTCFETILLMLLDTVLHLLLVWYIENVYPGIYKTRQHTQITVFSSRYLWHT
jgi:hypothetical protein